MAAALGLARDGQRVTVFERLADPNAGSHGLLLQPIALEALDVLGIGVDVRRHGARIERVRRTHEGRPIVELSYRELRPDASALGIHRATLYERLLVALPATGALLERGVEIVGLREAETEVGLRTASGEILGGFDALLVCDGARSRLRDLLPVRSHRRPNPWGVLSFTAPRSEVLDASTLQQRCRGAHDVVGLLPIGESPEFDDAVSFFWNVRVAQREALLPSDFAAWRTDVESLCPEAREILAGVCGFDQLLFSTWSDVRLPRWHTDRVIVLGEAAHAMNPQLGMGANMALVDAITLAAALRDTRAWEVGSAFSWYESQRRKQVSFYQNASRLMAPLLQTETRAIATLREWLLATTMRIPSARRRALRALGGYALSAGVQSRTSPGEARATRGPTDLR